LYHHLYHQNLHHTCSVKTRSGYFYTELKAAKFRKEVMKMIKMLISQPNLP